jgi:hypothetical protein
MCELPRQIIVTMVLIVIATAHIHAQDLPAASVPQDSASVREPLTSPGASGTRHALIVCGLAGDVPHRALFSGTIEELCAGLTTHHSFARDKVTVFWSDARQDNEGPAIKASRGPATREALAEAAAALASGLHPQDALWVFVLGHAHHDGKNTWLNLPGPDLNQIEFGKLFAEIQCAEQAFFITTAASGFFVKPLSKPGRIVIAATEADREFNETIFPHKLAATLSRPQPLAELDIDGDGHPSLLDLYLRVARDTAQEYANEMLLATEHAQLDDNGDGRGTELQADFLPEELGGRPTSGRKKPQLDSGDGAVARRLILALPPAPPSPPLPAGPME